jgi:hypothetical protein
MIAKKPRRDTMFTRSEKLFESIVKEREVPFEEVRKKLAEKNDIDMKTFWPYITIRSFLGDNGVRPSASIHGLSPDIWICKGRPDQSPAIPDTDSIQRTDQMYSFTLKEDYSVYGLIWNLGTAPAAGVQVHLLIGNLICCV